ncbi:unnamed protein product [marine sediment metagenome]|uniref:Uncharacterized protein n=1 Tax=marine sediment metagenome TaxID=412755 RepID=X1KY71_9ZZZZ
MKGKIKTTLLIAILLISTLAIAIPIASATTITLDLSDVDLDTIQECIDAAEAGDTIIVPVGSYIEDLTIDEGVTIEGK